MIRDTRPTNGVAYDGLPLNGTTVVLRWTIDSLTIHPEGRPEKSRGPHSLTRVRADRAFGYRVGGLRPSRSATRFDRFPYLHATRILALGIARSIADASRKRTVSEPSVPACRVPVMESSTHMSTTFYRTPVEDYDEYVPRRHLTSAERLAVARAELRELERHIASLEGVK